jgi:hypothetical protein
MSMRDHSQIEELMAVAALGGLDPEDERTLERARATHGACAECAALETEFAEVAGRLAFSLDPEPVDPAVADRILERSGREPVHAVGPGTGDRPMPDAPVVMIHEAAPRRRRRWTVAVGIAAALIVVAVVSVALVPRLGSVPTHVSAAQEIVHFTPADGAAPGEFSMAYTPGTPGAVVWGSDLPDPAAGKVYELWTITGSTPASAGCMQPAEGAVAMHIDQDVSGADSMAVTQEASTCPAAPTSMPVYAVTLST